MSGSLNNALEIVIRTDAGVIREHNEDAVFANPNQGFVILADGMGGYNAGEVASGMATMLLSTQLEAALATTPAHDVDKASGEIFAHRCVRESLAHTNLAVFNAANSQAHYAGMGTTLVMALFYDNRMTVAHIGDSRLYRLRDDQFSIITRDHSLLQEQIDLGLISAEAARFADNKNLVTRALGVDREVDAEIHDYPVRPGDIYLLCSDGLNDMVDDEEIQAALQTLSANLELAATQLIEMANDNGGRDNVSVILVKVLNEFPARRSWWARQKVRFG